MKEDTQDMEKVNLKKALITGATGQDGSYLSELLLDKGYEVYCMHRRCSVDNHLGKLDHLKGRVTFVCADLLDGYSINNAMQEIKPDEVYNLAAQSQVKVSFNQPIFTQDVNWFGTERLLDSIKKYSPKSKFYQASTSEMFGDVVESPQNEKTPFNPVSPYAESKLNAHKATIRAREEGIFTCCGILFNHESPRRGLEFVTRKITDGIARIKLGLPQRETGKDHLELGNLHALRDWGFAGDYVKAMWLMLQQDKPDNYVIATGKDYSVRKFIEVAANAADIEIKWEGKGLDEKGFSSEGKKIIAVNETYFRPTEVHNLCGDSSKAKARLKWSPKVDFKQLVEMMIKADIERLKNNKI